MKKSLNLYQVNLSFMHLAKAGFEKFHNAYKVTLQRIGFVILVFGGAFFVSKAIIDEDIRLLISASLIFVLGTCCLRVRTGVMAMLIYLPFMAFIRRLIYVFNPYVGLDPILIIISILTLFMFGYIFMFQGEYLLHQTRRNKLLRYTTYFILLLILQALNPLQGGLAVGLAGIMFWVIPALWFYFGFFVPKESMKTIIYTIVIIGVITALYGLRQIYYGFLPFENYWIKYGGFTALSVKGFIKTFSTFTSPQEFCCYLLIAGGVVFIQLFQKPLLYPLWIGSFIILMWGIFMTSSRGAIFYFLLLILIFILVKARSLKKGIIGGLIFITIAFWGVSRIKFPSGKTKDAQEAHLEHLARGVKNPLEEASFQARLEVIRITCWEMLHNPLGVGIGATTLGVGKFGGQVQGTAGGEIFQLAILGTCGIPGAILYIIVMCWIIRYALILIKKDSNTYLIPGVLAMWFGIAEEPRLYSIGPIFWLLWGWLAKEAGK